MTYFQAIVLGIVQGLTEFLPISSSGHLVLFSKIPGWSNQPLVFDTTLHLATAFTLLVYFFSDLLKLAQCFFKDVVNKNLNFAKYTSEAKLVLYLVVGSIPAALLGFHFEKDFEERFRSIFSVAFFMFMGTILMFLAQAYGRKKTTIQNFGYKKSIMLGVFQSLALFPGFSRSGSTISGALIMGLQRFDAAKLSFLMSMPIVVMAGVYKLITTDFSSLDISGGIIIAGFLSSFLSGLAVVHFLLSYLKTRNLDVFIWYRLVLVIMLMLIGQR